MFQKKGPNRKQTAPNTLKCRPGRKIRTELVLSSNTAKNRLRDLYMRGKRRMLSLGTQGADSGAFRARCRFRGISQTLMVVVTLAFCRHHTMFAVYEFQSCPQCPCVPSLLPSNVPFLVLVETQSGPKYSIEDCISVYLYIFGSKCQ